MTGYFICREDIMNVQRLQGGFVDHLIEIVSIEYDRQKAEKWIDEHEKDLSYGARFLVVECSVLKIGEVKDYG